MTKYILFIVLIGMLSFFVKDDKQSTANEIFDRIEQDYPWIGAGSSNMATFRATVEELDEVKALIELGETSSTLILEKFKQYKSLNNADEALSCYAYVLEMQNYEPAIKDLENFIESNPGLEHFVWSPYFAVRTLLVLKGEKDTTDGYKIYSDEDVIRALDQ